MVKQAAEEIKKEETKNQVAQKPATAGATVIKANPVVAKKKFTVNASGKKVAVASTIAKPVNVAKAVPATAAAKTAAAKTAT